MLRAAITPDEYASLRVLAIHREQAVQELVAEGVRIVLAEAKEQDEQSHRRGRQ